MCHVCERRGVVVCAEEEARSEQLEQAFPYLAGSLLSCGNEEVGWKEFQLGENLPSVAYSADGKLVQLRVDGCASLD